MSYHIVPSLVKVLIAETNVGFFKMGDGFDVAKLQIFLSFGGTR